MQQGGQLGVVVAAGQSGEGEQSATVVDIACGTGLNFLLIQERIGAGDTLIGVA